MEQAALDYLRHLRAKAASATFLYERFRLVRFFSWLVSRNKCWTTINRHDVESFLLSINGNPYTRYKAWKVLRDFYAFEKLPDDPTRGITFRIWPRPLVKVPSQAIIARKISSINDLPTETAQRSRLMAELAYGSGLRRRELALLDVDDLDLEQRTAFIQGKGDRKRVVPLTGKTVEAARVFLEERNAVHGPLFVAQTDPNKRRRLSLVRISVEFKRSTGLNTHAFRHACATHLLQNGCNIRVIQELLGHVNLTTTQDYTHITKDELRAIINRLHPRAGHRAVL
jgi:site-specific recombinase XerD